MKNSLIAMDNEIKEYYKVMINTSHINLEKAIKDFCSSTIALLDYYTEPIFNIGKLITSKKLNIKSMRNDFTDEEILFIKNYKNDTLVELENNMNKAILSCFDSENLLDQIMEIITSHSLFLFRYSQLSAYKNNNISKIYLIADDNCCSLCKANSRFTHNVENLINNIDRTHSFCKFSYETDYIISKDIFKYIESIKTKLNIYIPNLVSEYEFKFVDDISKNNMFVSELKSNYEFEEVNSLLNEISNNVITFKDENIVLISKDNINNLNYIITKSLIEDKIKNIDLTWWKESYYNKQNNKYVGNNTYIYNKPFVNYIAEQSYDNYFIESAVYYIVEPRLLKSIDSECYVRLREEVFNNVEFIKEW